MIIVNVFIRSHWMKKNLHCQLASIVAVEVNLFLINRNKDVVDGKYKSHFWENFGNRKFERRMSWEVKRKWVKNDFQFPIGFLQLFQNFVKKLK